MAEVLPSIQIFKQFTEAEPGLNKINERLKAYNFEAIREDLMSGKTREVPIPEISDLTLQDATQLLNIFLDSCGPDFRVTPVTRVINKVGNLAGKVHHYNDIEQQYYILSKDTLTSNALQYALSQM